MTRLARGFSLLITKDPPKRVFTLPSAYQRMDISMVHETTKQSNSNSTDFLSITDVAASLIESEKHELDRGPIFRAYPAINVAATEQKRIAELRVWYAARFIHNQAGMTVGNIGVDELESAICDKESLYYFFSKRRLQTILKKGQGEFWEVNNDRVYFKNPAKIAYLLNTNLYGFRLDIPFLLLTTHSTARAAFYRSYEDGRRNNDPLSRQRQEEVSGVPSRTQRHYDAQLGAKEIENFLVAHLDGKPAEYNKYNLERVRLALGDDRPLYSWTDKKGKLGVTGKKYIKYPIASNRTRTFKKSSGPGALRKWKKKLTHLIKLGERQWEKYSKLYRVYPDDGKIDRNDTNGRYLLTKELDVNLSVKALLSPTRVYALRRWLTVPSYSAAN